MVSWIQLNNECFIIPTNYFPRKSIYCMWKYKYEWTKSKQSCQQLLQELSYSVRHTLKLVLTGYNLALSLATLLCSHLLLCEWSIVDVRLLTGECELSLSLSSLVSWILPPPGVAFLAVGMANGMFFLQPSRLQLIVIICNLSFAWLVIVLGELCQGSKWLEESHLLKSEDLWRAEEVPSGWAKKC